LFKQVGKPQDLPVRFLPGPIVEDDMLRNGKPFGSAAVEIDLPERDVGAVEIPKVQKAPHRHVGIAGALVFVQVQLCVDEEGQVVLHGKIEHVFQCVDLQFFRVVIIGPVDCVIKIQKILLVAKDKAKQTVLVLAVRMKILLSMQLSIHKYLTFIIGNKTTCCNL